MNIRTMRLVGLILRFPLFFPSVLKVRYLSEPENNSKYLTTDIPDLVCLLTRTADDQQDGLGDLVTDTAVVAGVAQLQTGDVERGERDWPLSDGLQTGSLPPAWSTLIGRGMSKLGSHWSRASLVMLAPAILCHKERWFFLA